MTPNRDEPPIAAPGDAGDAADGGRRGEAAPDGALDGSPDWTIADVERLTPAEAERFWARFERELARDDGAAAREHLAAGRWISYVERDTPPVLLIRHHPDGRRELVNIAFVRAPGARETGTRETVVAVLPRVAPGPAGLDAAARAATARELAHAVGQLRTAQAAGSAGEGPAENVGGDAPSLGNPRAEPNTSPHAPPPPWWAAATPTAADVAARLADVEDVIASQRLEGLEPDPATVAQLRRVAAGELTVEDVLADIRARIARGEL